MTITTKEVELGCNIDNFEQLIILPENYYDKEGFRYHESSLSFYKYAKEQLNVEFFDEPEVLLEQRSGEWFGPVLFVSSIALTHSPELISIATGVIANYLTDFFKGKNEPDVDLKILFKETSKTKYTEVHYKGKAGGLSEVNNAIHMITESTTNDD